MHKWAVGFSAVAIGAAILPSAAWVSAAAPPGRYTVSGGTVLDNKTHLTWQQVESPGTYTWGLASTAGTAQQYCAALTFSGGGWRVPSLKELGTLVDFSVPPPGPTLDGVAFPDAGTAQAYFWTSTPSPNLVGMAYVIYFVNGGVAGFPEANPFKVRCVR